MKHAIIFFLFYFILSNFILLYLLIYLLIVIIIFAMFSVISLMYRFHFFQKIEKNTQQKVSLVLS